jgi:multiple sugar transport system permease protein
MTAVNARATRGRWGNALLVALIYVITLAFLFPILYLALTAFRPPADVFSVLTVGLRFSLTNFRDALGWKGVRIAEAFINSGIIATTSTLLSLIVTLPSGFMLARYRTRLAQTWFFTIYVIRTIPYISWLLPLFLLAQRFGFYDTYPGIIAAQAAFHVTFYSWIFKGFFEGTSRELEEAALVDGCSRWGSFVRISVPLAIPGIMAAGVLGWIWGWNELLLTLFLTSDHIPMYSKTISTFITEMGVEWGRMAATGVMAMVPAIAVTAFCHRYIVAGLGGLHQR